MSLSTTYGGELDRGQSTVEYGLVMMLAGTLALAVIVWVRQTGVITGLFEDVIDKLTGDL
jgi:hypothetical protein